MHFFNWQYSSSNSKCDMIAMFCCTGDDAAAVDLELMKLLWEEQRKAIKGGRQHHWHPKIIKWYLSIWRSSHSKYKQLADAGFLRLLHPRTLQRHANKLDVEQGLTPERLSLLTEKVADFPEGPERVEMLVFDEMHIDVGITGLNMSGMVTVVAVRVLCLSSDSC